ncbi:aminoglycoside adenylyltransferase domain-containing protein [Brevibacillus ginsengisoli]|uniref:aminoglycoside adenylyltransferase domain-containing protein n=1 Tax=Brevibacillus ginsengisoli TaxID=363854 RepID=UPI003CF17AA8
MTINSRLPDQVKDILDVYFNRFQSNFPDLLEAFHLYGSVSLGAFIEGLSDIDFVAVVQRNLSEADLAILKQIHREIQRKYPRTSLDGIYITKEAIEGLNIEAARSCLYFNDGKFRGVKEFHQNSIDAYQLKNFGIPIIGMEPQKYNFLIDWDLLIHHMWNNLNTYWVHWKNKCEGPLSIQYVGLYLSPHMIEWGVLGVSRLFYSFKENGITSKVGAGEYALQNVPERWHKIIHESMRLRKGMSKSYYSSIFDRRNDALAYMEYLIQESNFLLSK